MTTEVSELTEFIFDYCTTILNTVSENLNTNLDSGFKDGTIRLEETPAVYYSGQTINGCVIFDLNRPLNFSALQIQYVGAAKVRWSYPQMYTVNGVQRTSEAKYTAHEEYFNITTTLAGGHGTSQLPRTHHSFPFKFQIPFTAPSSFKGPKGNISYKIIATMIHPGTRKEVLEKEFRVVAPLDLNTGNPAIKEPVIFEFEELSPCNWCFDSGIILVRIKLPVTGYCPGQTIPIAIEVDNQSSLEITGMVFEILTRERYRSTQPPSEHIVPEKVLASVKRGPVMSKTKKNITCPLVVPDMIVPYLEHCTIIDVGYFFRATVTLSGCYDDLQDESEICLGLVPLRETLTGEYVHPMADKLPSGPIPINDGIPVINQPQIPTPEQTNQNMYRSQPNLNQSYPDNPPPYPGRNMPYPTDNKFRNSTGNIGFRIPNPSAPYPGSTQTNPPNPSANLMPGGVPPYPVNNTMPGTNSPQHPTVTSSSGPGYPTNNSDVPPTYPQAGFAPSAPPALD